jgi:hypothetical protein
MTGLRGVEKAKTAVTVLLSACLLTAGLAFTAEIARAEAPKIMRPAEIHHGTVVTNSTAKGRIMKIDKDHFQVSPQVVVTDRQGKRREVSEVMPGEQIKFHMTKGEIDRIECECPPRQSRPGSR